MHEFSLVQSLLTLIEQHVTENRAAKVNKIVVTIGKLAGVEAELFQIAFDTFKEKTVAQDAKMVIEMVDLVIQCDDCQKEYVLQQYVFQCPECGGVNIKTIAGEDMFLQSLELET